GAAVRASWSSRVRRIRPRPARQSDRFHARRSARRAWMKHGMKVEFVKPQGRRYRSVMHRRDGLVVELDGGGYNKVGGAARELPHDLAHFVVEDGLELEAGLWGVLAAGGMFGHARVIAGRRAPHAAKRAQAVVDAAGDRLSQAEMLTRFVCDLA